MAELPDLTVFAQILSRRFKGKTLKEIEVKVAKKFKPSSSEVKSALEGKKLSTVSREGKTLQFHFAGEHVLGLHLMLRGELKALEKNATLPKHTVFAFHFSGGEGFAVVDILKQATPTLNPETQKSPDALEMGASYFTDLLAKKKKMVKEVLMDQKLMRGIGNSYADEILWDAGISPFSIANTIPDKEVKTLFRSLKGVLEKAISDIAAENEDELVGELRDFMKVHGSKIEKSPTGGKVKSEKIGGRTAYYTDEQKLYS
ncbi:Fpg/Nei family DNA glycosylase [Pedobacter boryungensis]|uniref:Formamidopyrimidine-DNA glycosylase n=1 Tax=Pedobacter boryungensis TaxID=869962 RepID=A0ABX2DAJ8_9SPHI|nr:DNA-formamidopyrimidine glycosylase family protein [Pedobacter boryungensis]NQX31078.1 formamidopyrimidine-DNA glycosylase [Pedobacter boryungensis]